MNPDVNRFVWRVIDALAARVPNGIAYAKSLETANTPRPEDLSKVVSEKYNGRRKLNSFVSTYLRRYGKDSLSALKKFAKKYLQKYSPR